MSISHFLGNMIKNQSIWLMEKKINYLEKVQWQSYGRHNFKFLIMIFDSFSLIQKK